VFEEITVQGTPLPGTVMELVPGVAPINGRFTYQASPRANGKDRLPAILQEDSLQGFPVGTAYTSGTRGRIYIPVPGEELNVLVDVPGTGTGSHGGTQIGEYLEYDSAGHLTVETGSPEGTAWMALEYVADNKTLTPVLTWCKYLGT
jgi:hypothetical protein